MKQEAENARIAIEQPDLSVTMTGAMRCLQSIIYNIINEIVQRLVKSTYELELPLQSGIEGRHGIPYKPSYCVIRSKTKEALPRECFKGFTVE